MLDVDILELLNEREHEEGEGRRTHPLAHAADDVVCEAAVGGVPLGAVYAWWVRKT